MQQVDPAGCKIKRRRRWSANSPRIIHKTSGVRNGVLTKVSFLSLLESAHMAAREGAEFPYLTGAFSAATSSTKLAACTARSTASLWLNILLASPSKSCCD